MDSNGLLNVVLVPRLYMKLIASSTFTIFLKHSYPSHSLSSPIFKTKRSYWCVMKLTTPANSSLLVETRSRVQSWSVV